MNETSKACSCQHPLSEPLGNVCGTSPAAGVCGQSCRGLAPRGCSSQGNGARSPGSRRRSGRSFGSHAARRPPARLCAPAVGEEGKSRVLSGALGCSRVLGPACARRVWKSSHNPHGYPRASALAPRHAAHAIPPAGPPRLSPSMRDDFITPPTRPLLARPRLSAAAAPRSRRAAPPTAPG